MKVSVPPLPVQRRIAGILSAYDELMENSQRRIRILEAMARALYREWFVHFRFPGHEKLPRVASPLGDIPQGWEVKDRMERNRKARSIRVESARRLYPDWGFPYTSNVSLGRFDPESCPDEQRPMIARRLRRYIGDLRQWDLRRERFLHGLVVGHSRCHEIHCPIRKEWNSNG